VQALELNCPARVGLESEHLAAATEPRSTTTCPLGCMLPRCCSLGGALSTLCTYDCARRTWRNNVARPNIVHYNFGSPRVGNRAFAEDVSGLDCQEAKQSCVGMGWNGWPP
jgi:hypothetical protein